MTVGLSVSVGLSSGGGKSTADPAQYARAKVQEFAPSPCAAYSRHGERDVFAELRKELDATVTKVTAEYAGLFLLNEDGLQQALSGQEKSKRLYYHLNKVGGYLELKEALKPCLQRIVAEKVEGSEVFVGKAPNLDSSEGDRFIGKVFEFLLAEVNNSMNRMFVPECVVESRTEIKSDIKATANVPEKCLKLKMLAEDCEGNGKYAEAEGFHLERLRMALHEATFTKGGLPHLRKAKADYGQFLLIKAGIPAQFNEAKQELKGALSLDVEDWHTATLLAALSLELGDLEDAGPLLAALSPPPPADEDGRASHENSAVVSVMQALRHETLGDQASKRSALRVASRAGKANSTEGKSLFPQRHLIRSLLDAADYFNSYNLIGLSARCVALSEECETKAKALALSIGAPSCAPGKLRSRHCLVKGKLLLQKNDLEGANALLLESELRTKGTAYAGASALAFSETYWALGDEFIDLATEKLILCLRLVASPVPFKVYCRLFTLLFSKGRYAEAREVYFQAAQTWKYPSVWLGISRTSIKLGFLEDAEDSLQEANGADTQDACAWGLFCVVCLKGGGSRLGEANNSLTQALLLGLKDVGIVREMGELFSSIDQLVQAESLWRRGMELTQDGERENVEFGLALAGCLGRKNEHDGAIEVYEDVLVKGKAGGGGQQDNSAAVLKECEDNLEALRVKLGRN